MTTESNSAADAFAGVLFPYALRADTAAPEMASMERDIPEPVNSTGVAPGNGDSRNRWAAVAAIALAVLTLALIIARCGRVAVLAAALSLVAAVVAI